MTDETQSETRVLGSLHAVEGQGVVRIETRYDAGAEAVWSAVTDPVRLAGWYGEVSGDLREGGELQLYVPTDQWRGTGRVKVCEPERRVLLTTRESGETAKDGPGVAPFDKDIEVTLRCAGDATLFRLEVTGLPLDKIEYFGVGWQIHAERLETYLSGVAVGDTEPRWDVLIPAYQELAAAIR